MGGFYKSGFKTKSMWKVYLIEFVIVVIISISWVYIIDKHKNQKK